MATSLGQVTAIVSTVRRDARQSTGLVALGFLGLLVAVALGTTIISGLSGDWASGFKTVGRVTVFTLWQAVLSLALSVTLAIPVAVALDALPQCRARRFILLLFTIPLALPVIVAVMALLAWLGRNGILSQFAQVFGSSWKPDIYGLSGILIAHVFFNMPLAVRMIVQRFDAIPEEQWKLGESLRFNAWERFTLLHWPAIRTILPGLSSLIFLLCVGSYTIILVLGGGLQTTTLQVAIYQALSFDFDTARAALLTLMQLFMTFVLLWLLPKAQLMHLQTPGNERRRHYDANMANQLGNMAVLAAGSTLIALPLIAIVISGFAGNHTKLIADPLLWRALGTSLAIGLPSALLAVVLACALSAANHAYTKRGPSLTGRVLTAAPLATLAIPSLVLGVGWFLFVIKTGLPLSIAPLLVIFANAMMALPFAMQILEPAIHQNFNSNDRLATSLGMSGFNRLRIIDVPVMRNALLTAGLFAFALSLGDLGVVTLFGADQILTLPALIFQKMGSYRSNDAAGLALYLGLLTGLVTLLAMKAQRNDHA